MNKEQFKSPAKLENIPIEIRGLKTDILDLVNNVYAKYEVLAVYWIGSIPRGEFIFGESDADFEVIVKKPLHSSHRKERGELTSQLFSKWQKLGITQIDIIAMSIEEVHDGIRRASLFFDLSDGIEITSKQPIDLNFVLPKSSKELVEVLCGSFGLWIQDVENGELDEELSIKQLTKRSIRAIYGLAILHGAPYERNWRKYGPAIEKYLQKYSKDYKALCSSKEWSVQEILTLSIQIRNELLKSGVVMLQDWPNKK